MDVNDCVELINKLEKRIEILEKGLSDLNVYYKNHLDRHHEE